MSAKMADIVDVAIRYGIERVDDVFVYGRKTRNLNIVEEKDLMTQ